MTLSRWDMMYVNPSGSDMQPSVQSIRVYDGMRWVLSVPRLREDDERLQGFDAMAHISLGT